jgi:peptide/nickel transport system permease protein
MAGDSNIMTVDEIAAVAGRRRQMRRQFARLFGNPLSAVGLALSAAFVLMAIAAPLLAPHDPLAMDPSKRLEAPSALHWFGTDDGGRDILARVIYGTRSSLLTALGILSLASVIGTSIGLAAGYFGGWVDETLMRITDMFLAFPALVLAMGLAAALGPSLFNAMLATAVVWWPWYARLVRGQALHLKNEAFVEAPAGWSAPAC